MRILQPLLLSLLLVSRLGSLPARADEPWRVQVTQVDNSRYPEVTVYVSVTDASDQVVSGLTPNDFIVTEDGTPVQIVDFRGGDQVALATVLVIDRSGSMNDENKLVGAKQAASTFVNLMRSQDQAALVSFANDVRVDQSFTSDTTTLKRAINALPGDGGTAWYDALYQAAGLVGSIPGRRSIILLTDGLDNQSSRSLDKAIEAARTAGIPVFAIGLGNQPTGADFLSQLASSGGGYDEKSLKRTPQLTDGKFYHAPSATELKALYESLAVGMQHDYAITYRSPRPTFDGTRRNIVMTVGGTTGGSQYLETHLLNLRSDVLVGILLLLPLALALVVPTLRRKSSRALYPEPSAPLSPTRSPSGAPQPRPPVMPNAAALVCSKCGALLRPNSRFCAKCGTASAPPAGPATCPNCGNALKLGAKFCNRCGHRTI